MLFQNRTSRIVRSQSHAVPGKRIPDTPRQIAWSSVQGVDNWPGIKAV